MIFKKTHFHFKEEEIVLGLFFAREKVMRALGEEQSFKSIYTCIYIVKQKETILLFSDCSPLVYCC